MYAVCYWNDAWEAIDDDASPIDGSRKFYGDIIILCESLSQAKKLFAAMKREFYKHVGFGKDQLATLALFDSSREMFFRKFENI